MTIDRKKLEHLEALARIELDDAERENLASQLDRIVAFVEKLQSVNTESVKAGGAFEHLEVGGDRLRDDRGEVDETGKSRGGGLSRDAVLSQAPDASAGCFRVPRVIDLESER